MVIFLNLDGSCQKITPEHIYQGSNNVTDITVVAPFSPDTAMGIGFILPNGRYWTNDDGVRYMPMEFAEQSVNQNVSAWHFALPDSVTAVMGDLYIAFNAVTITGNTTSYMCKVQIEESVLPNDAPPPDMSVYDYLKMYLARLDGRTKYVPNLVARIQKVKGSNNAFTYTDNSGVVSDEIILGDPYAAPIPVNAASAIKIPGKAWQPTYAEDNTTVTGYTYLLTSAMHGQMRDGATAKDLWVSFDEAVTGGLKGATGDYTVNESGDITITVNQPVAMTVRVWNGKGLVDKVARDDIAAETQRAEQAEQAIRTDMNAADSNLQEQINELVNTGIDTVARAAIAAETERAESAESELQQDLNTAQEQLQGQINTIDSYIPSSTTTENQLADKAFVNSSINNMAAFYITSNAAGAAFSTQASLLNATTYYYGGQPRTPTQNDYAIVLADESQPKNVDGKYPTTRYSYQGSEWSFQYVVNNTPLTQDQVNAINSGITKEIVTQITEGSVTGVKGSTETTYRTGNVNLTPENIGALPTSGGTVTGNLTVAGNTTVTNPSINASSNYEALHIYGFAPPNVAGQKSDINFYGNGGLSKIGTISCAGTSTGTMEYKSANHDIVGKTSIYNGTDSTYIELGKKTATGLEFHCQQGNANLDYDAYIKAMNTSSSTEVGSAELYYGARNHVFQGRVYSENNAFYSNGNELNFLYNYSGNPDVYINYRDSRTLINTYRFYNGLGSAVRTLRKPSLTTGTVSPNSVLSSEQIDQTLKVVTVWATESSEYGTLGIRVGSSGGLRIAYTEGEHKYWGAATLCVTAVLAGQQGIYIEGSNIGRVNYSIMYF